MTHTVFLGLGTNLGDRERNIEAALDALRQVMTLDVISPYYETAPWGVLDQPHFLNLCVRASTTLYPEELLRQLKSIEFGLGREIDAADQRWGPRPIDIDILLYDDWTIVEADLIVPHAWMHKRAFVLQPLRDIAPDVIHPILQKTIAELANELGSDGAKRVQAPVQHKEPA